MARFIKAYNEKDHTVFEVGVTAVNERLAKTRGTIYLIGRSPAQATAVDNIEVIPMGNGRIREHRVLIKLKDDESIEELLNVDEAIAKFQELL